MGAVRRYRFGSLVALVALVAVAILAVGAPAAGGAPAGEGAPVEVDPEPASGRTSVAEPDTPRAPTPAAPASTAPRPEPTGQHDAREASTETGDGAPGSLEVVLDAVPDDAQDVAFHLCPADGAAACTAATTSILLDDDADATLPSSSTSTLPAGRYRVVQDAVPGWELASLSCSTDETVDRGRHRVLVELGEGEEVSCTFVNRRPGLTLVQDTQPSGAQDFATQLCDATSSCQTIVLDDDDDPTLPGAATFADLAPGVYTVSQTAVPGYGLVDLRCDDATGSSFDREERSATLTVADGVSLVCTLVDRATSVTVVHFTDERPYPNPQDFHYSACRGLECTEFDLDRDQDPVLSDRHMMERLEEGVWTLTQQLVPGYPLDRLDCGRGEADLVAGSVTFSLAPGDRVTCNASVDPATVAVFLDAVPDAPEDVGVSFCPQMGPCRSTTLDDDADPALAANGFFGALETGPWTLRVEAPAGWAVTRLQCPRGTADLGAGSIEVDVAAGQDLNCNVTVAQTSITIVQDTVPNGPQDVVYTGCAGPAGAHGCGDFTLDDDPGDATFPSRLVATSVTPGEEYTVVQHEVEGFGLSGISCNDAQVELAQRRVTIVVDPGEQVSCTFTMRPTTMTVVHDAVPGSALDVAYTGCAGPGGVYGCGEFLLDDDSDPTLPASLTGTGLVAGQEYSVAVDVPDGHGLVSVACTTGDVDLAAGRVTFVLRAGEQASCTFVSRPTTLTIVQDTRPDGAPDFTFTGCAGPGGAFGCGPFLLDDDTDPALPRSRTFSGLQADVTYSIVQEAAEGHGLVGITCTGPATTSEADRRATLVLRPGEQVTCTFVSQATTLTIVQDTVPNDPQDFTYVGCAGPGGANGCATFHLDDDSDATLARSVTYTGLTAGLEYSVVQAESPGMGLTALSCTDGEVSRSARRAVVVLDPGDQVTCTFTDRPTTFRLVLSTPTATARDLAFDVCLGTRSCAVVTLDTDEDATLASQALLGALPGETVSVTLRDTPGYGLRSISCTSGASSVSQRRATVLVDAGEQWSCTFTVRATSLTVVQDTAPSDPVDLEFTGCAGPGGAYGCGTFRLDDDLDPTLASVAVYDELVAGQPYTVTQHDVAGFALADLHCSSGTVDVVGRRFTVVLEPGDQVTCTFVTRRTQLTLQQVASPSRAQDFPFTVCGPSPDDCTDVTLDDDTDPALASTAVLGPLPPGTYTVTQAEVDGWGVTSLTCAGADVDRTQRRVTLRLAPGDQLTCRFQASPTRLTISEDTPTSDGHAFDFTSCRQGGSCEAFSLADDGGPARSVTFEALTEGRYEVTQAAEAGYSVAVTCSNGLLSTSGRTVIVDVRRGEHTTCTFSNRPTELYLDVSVTPASNQAFSFTVCGPVGCAPVLASEGSLGFPPRGQVYGVPAGTYTVTLDDVPAGWTFVEMPCGANEQFDPVLRRVTLTLEPGDPVFCRPDLRQPTVTVVADTEADAPRDLDFTFCPTAGGGCTTFALDDDADATLPRTRQFAPLAPGTYTVTQAAVEDWVITSISCSTGERIDLAARRATITLAAGEVTTCTFVNTTPSVTVVHDAVPNSGTDVAYTFCQVATTTCSTVILDDDANATRAAKVTFPDLVPGRYTVTSASVAGRAVTALSCSTGETVDLGARQVTIDLSIGEVTRCTFTNVPA